MADPYVAYAEACEASGTVPLAHVLENMSQAPLGVIDARGFSGGARVCDADCGPLGEAIAASGTTAFYASNNEIGDAGVAALVADGRSAGLNTLDLSVNAIGGAGAAALCKALAADARELYELNLDRNPLGEEGGHAVAGLIASHGTLESVRVSHCELNAAALVALASALSRTVSLRVLDISETRTLSRNEETVAHLARALRGNASLERLVMRKHAHMVDSGVDTLCDALLDNAALRELDLSANALGPPAGAALAKALVDGAQLTALRLSACRVGDQGAVALADALKRGGVLTVLDLRYNSIGDAGVAALAAALTQEACALQVLLWWGNPGLRPGTPGASAWGAALASGNVRAVTDTRAYIVDDEVHVAREDIQDAGGR
jgi:Ran GTPase-activating protein (RanGAP) involved in mRNA processing and transport